MADRHICRINRCGALQPAARNYPCGTTREDLDELYLSDIQSVNWEAVREELRVLPVYDHTVDWSDGFADAFGGRGSPIRES